MREYDLFSGGNEGDAGQSDAPAAAGGRRFWERILSAVSDENLSGSGFSEFETYGNYVQKYHPGMYELRTLRGLRKGAEFFGTAPTAAQLQWAAKSYDTIAFERWSHSRKWMNQLCGNSLVMLFPLSWTLMQKIRSHLRNGV